MVSTRLSEESERRAEAIRHTWRALDDIEEIAESPDGHVVVTVDARGHLRRLELDPRVYRNADAAALAKAITDATAEAAANARRRAFELVRPLLPPSTRAPDADLAFGPLLAELDRMTR